MSTIWNVFSILIDFKILNIIDTSEIVVASSRCRIGKYFYYYKCKNSKHNNISAAKSHEEFLDVCQLMSLSTDKIKKIRSEIRSSIDREMEGNRKKVIAKKIELQEIEEKLYSVEEKWIKNEISKDTYDRWQSIYTDNISTMNNTIERWSNDQTRAFNILEKNLSYLSDLRYVYFNSDTLRKREFVNLVFDSNLYYESGIYRTPTMHMYYQLIA